MTFMTSIPDARHMLFDCDGVLLNWLDGFISFAQDHVSHHLDPENLDSFDLSDWLGVDIETMNGLINAFNSGDNGSFGRLKPMPGAVELVEKARAADMELHIITACSSLRVVQDLRRENLAEVFGKDAFRQIHFVDLHGSKADLLDSYSPAVWIEDNYDNALLGQNAGHLAHVIRQSHNRLAEERSAPGLIWIDTLGDIDLEHILPACA